MICLVNIGLGRGIAQKRVSGGRWRRIVLGDVQKIRVCVGTMCSVGRSVW